MSISHSQGHPATGFARIDLVDNWHREWPNVLRALDKAGHLASLQIDGDGWLSARQNLLVAFVENQPAAHVCFHVKPVHGEGSPSQRHYVEAELDAFGIDPCFCGHGIEHSLRTAALDRASMLNCRKLRGFDLEETWC